MNDNWGGVVAYPVRRKHADAQGQPARAATEGPHDTVEVPAVTLDVALDEVGGVQKSWPTARAVSAASVRGG